jgi:hypothetical protein
MNNPEKINEVKQYLETNPNTTLLAAARKLKISRHSVKRVKVLKLGMVDDGQKVDRKLLKGLDYEEMHFCNQCESSFRDVSYLKNHIQKVHSGRNFICFICSRAFKNAEHLRRHEGLHSKPNFKSRGFRRTKSEKIASAQAQSKESVMMSESSLVPKDSERSEPSSTSINNNTDNVLFDNISRNNTTYYYSNNLLH